MMPRGIEGHHLANPCGDRSLREETEGVLTMQYVHSFRGLVLVLAEFGAILQVAVVADLVLVVPMS